MKSVIHFDLIKLGENDYGVDLTNVYIKGVVNLYKLNELLTNEISLCYIGSALKKGKLKRMKIEVWEDTDGYKKWLDFNVID